MNEQLLTSEFSLLKKCTMIRLISLCFLFFISFNGYSQLERKVQFGARVEYVTENGTSGCKVLQVARGTSVALQLQEKDLILKIGNSTFASTTILELVFNNHLTSI